jgi:hypothetical protein
VPLDRSGIEGAHELFRRIEQDESAESLRRMLASASLRASLSLRQSVTGASHRPQLDRTPETGEAGELPDVRLVSPVGFGVRTVGEPLHLRYTALARRRAHQSA